MRTSLLHAADASADLFEASDYLGSSCILFADTDFLDDLHSTDMGDLGIVMLKLLVEASSTVTLQQQQQQQPRHNQSRIKLSNGDSRAMANKSPPATQGQINALAGTVEGDLVREAQVDEVMSMIREKRVLPIDLRTLDKHVYQIDGKWVTKYKKTLQGLLERVCSRWALRGDRQLPHRDYDPEKVYSPVATKTTHFTLFVIAVQYSLLLFCLDVSKAFMMGPMDRAGVCMWPPIGFREKHPDFCPFGEFTTYELLCSLCGLKQAAAVYYDTVKKLVIAYVFPDGSHLTLSPADPCLFVHGSRAPESNHYVTFSTHVDDKFIACKTIADRDVVASIFTAAKWAFTLETMDLVLGFTIRYKRHNPADGEDTSTLELCHSSHIESTYAKFSSPIPPSERGSRSTPIKQDRVNALTAEAPPTWQQYDKDRHAAYRSVLGTVAHLANFTHPEVLFAVSFASQFMENPSAAALAMVLGILQYLYCVKGKCVVFKRQKHPCIGSPICIACDADLGNSHRKGRSRTGMCVYLFGNLVNCCSRLQPSASLSTAEAEYMAIAAAGRFAVWYKMLVGDMGIEASYRKPADIFSDNNSARMIASNPITHKHSHHIDRRLHWLREMTMGTGPAAAALRIHFIGTAVNVSDIMTKACSPAIFKQHRTHLFEGFRFAARLSAADATSFLTYLIRDIDKGAYLTGLEEMYGEL